jgi:hypothetical protein
MVEVLEGDFGRMVEPNHQLVVVEAEAVVGVVMVSFQSPYMS